MSRQRVYIAGPISKGDLAANINQATEAFLALAKAGFAPMCPHWSSFSGGAKVFASPFAGLAVGTVYAVAGANPNELTHGDWLAIDLEWVRVSDAVLRLPGESTGADLEVAEAVRRGIPVFFDAGRVIDWFRAAGAT